jgi:hypothetical protein
MSLFSPFRLNEQYVVACEVTKDEAGHGTLYKGKYYHLDYEPLRDNRDYKCTGVKLTTRRNAGSSHTELGLNNAWVNIQFKPGIIFNKGAYKDRLSHAISECKQRIIKGEKQIDVEIERKTKAIADAKIWELNEVVDREKAVAEHVKKIKKCQVRIDATMKRLVPEAESVVEAKAAKAESNEIVRKAEEAFNAEAAFKTMNRMMSAEPENKGHEFDPCQ